MAGGIVTYNPGWTAGARTIAVMTGDGQYTWTVGQAIGIVCGLNDNDLTAGQVEIRHGFLIEGNHYQVMELGTLRGYRGGYVSGAEFKITRIAGVVRYYVAGILVYTSTTLSIGTRFLDCSMYYYGDEIWNAAYANLYYASSGINLSPLTAFGMEGDLIVGEAILSPMAASGTAYTPNRAELRLQPLSVLGVQGGAILLDAKLSPLVAHGDQGLPIPEYAVANLQLSPLFAWGFQTSINRGTGAVTLTPLKAFGISGNLIICDATIAPLEVTTYRGLSDYISSACSRWTMLMGEPVRNVIEYPELEVVSYVSQPSCIAEIDYPELTVSAYNGISATIAYPDLTVAAVSPGQRIARGVIDYPELAIAATGISGNLAQGVLQYPPLDVLAYTGIRCEIIFDPVVVASDFKSGATASAAIQYPTLELSASARTGTLIRASIQYPELLVTAGNGWRATLIYPEFEVSGSFSFDPEHAHSNIVISPAKVSGIEGEDSIADLVLASLSASIRTPATDDPEPDADSVVYAVNIATHAVTKLTYGSFSKIVSAHGAVYGLIGNTIYKLGTTTPMADAIVRFAQQTFGTANVKRMDYVYLQSRTPESMTVELVKDETSVMRHISTPTEAESYATHRCKIGKGNKFYTAGLTVRNRNGSQFELGGLDLRVTPLSRRVK